MRGLIAAARPVVRDMFATKWRLIVSVLLIALPVAVISALTIDAESVSRSIANEQPGYTLNYQGGTCTQNFDGSDFQCDGTSENSAIARNHPANFAAYVKDNLPEGIEAGLHLSLDASIGGGHGGAMRTTVDQWPLEDLPAGYGDKLDNGGIVLPHQMAENLGIDIGDSVMVTTELSSQRLTVSGFSPGPMAAVAPGTLAKDAAEVFAVKNTPDDSNLPYWNLTSSRDITWDDVTQLNKAGFTVYPRGDAKIAGAPEPEQSSLPNLPFSISGALSNALFDAVFVSMYIIAALLILLLLSPVFALAFNRHTRMFALMSSQGASPRQIRLAVLTYAGLTGLLGGVTGLVIGIIVETINWKATYPDWPMTLAPKYLAGYLAITVVGAMLSALFPAFMVSRNALAAGIAGAEPDRILGWRKWMAIGPAILAVEVVIVIGLVIAKGTVALDWIFSTSPVFILATVIGLAASTPAILLGTARMLQNSSLAMRTASRGLLRRSARVLPVVAAIVCVTFVGTVVLVGSSADSRAHLKAETLTTSSPTVVVQTSNLFTDQPSQEGTSASTDLQTQLRATANRVAEKVNSSRILELREVLPNYLDSDGVEVQIKSTSACTTVRPFLDFNATTPEDFVGSNGKSAATDPQAAADCVHEITRFASSSPVDAIVSTAVVQKPDEVALWALSAEEKTEAQRVISDGGVLVPRGTSLTDGKATIELYGDESADGAQRSEDFRAAAVLPPISNISVVFSEEAAHALEVPVQTMGYAVMLNQAVADYDVDSLDDVTKELPAQFSNMIGVNPNYYLRDTTGDTVGSLAIVGVSLVAIVLVIFLAASGLRRDNATLISIGASPKLVARIAAIEAALTTLLGMGIGVALGHIAMALLATHDRYSAAGELISLGLSQYIRPDWILIGGVFVVTAIAALLAWFVHRPGTTDAAVARRRE